MDRALIVEESEEVAAALRGHLEAVGLAVDRAGEAEAVSALRREHALAVVRAERPDVTAALKAARGDLPVVLVYRTDDEAAAAPAAAEADGVLVAPLQAATVGATARAMVRLHAMARRIAELQKGSGPARESLELHRRLVLMEVKRARRYRYPLGLAVIAIDNWAEVAPALGAEGRARLLAGVLALIARGLRTVDLPVLHAKERFLVIMPHTPPEGALLAANRLCARIVAQPGPTRLAASAGVACFEGQGAVSLASLLAEAHRGLERARAAGGGKALRGGGGRPERKVDLGW